MKSPGPETVSVSVDMDAPVDYSRFYRLREELSSSRFLAEVVPRFLDLFAEHGVRATFFCIGRDARDVEGARWHRRLVEAGHEIGNHTDEHPIAFRSLPRERRAQEIDGASRRLEDVTGQRIVGFRAPAYDLDDLTLELLIERGFEYDSSLNPSPFLLPMKAVVAWKGRRLRIGLGRFSAGFANAGPHFLARRDGRLHRSRSRPEGASIVELPLAVSSMIRFPFYGTIVQMIGLGPFRRMLRGLRRGSRPVVYELHALELAGGEGSPAPGSLASVPGYGFGLARRATMVVESIAELAEGSRFVTLRELAAEVVQSGAS